MKKLAPVLLGVLIFSCSLDLSEEDLTLDLPGYFTSRSPDVAYRLKGGDHLQGFVRLFPGEETGVSSGALSAYDTVLPFPSSGQGSFRFRQPLEERAYLIQSSLSASRGGVVSQLLGSSKEGYFSVIPRPDLPPAAPSWKLSVNEKTGRLVLRLVHPLRLDVWKDNPLVFHGVLSRSSDTLEPADPLDPDFTQPSQVWNSALEERVFHDSGTGQVYSWVKATGAARLPATDRNSTPALFEHRFSLTLGTVAVNGQHPVVRPVRKSDPETIITMKPQWTFYDAAGLPVAAREEEDVRVTIVNLVDGSSVRIPLGRGPLYRNNWIPLMSAEDAAAPRELKIQSGDLKGLSVLAKGTDPNCEIILTVAGRAFGGQSIYVED